MAIEGGTSPATTGDVQAELAGMRRDLLGGRGPGASAVEVLQHTRARIRVGAETVPQLRQRVAFQTGSARGDTDVLAHRVAEDRARLTDSLASALGPERSARPGGQGRLLALLAGLVLRALGRRRRP